MELITVHTAFNPIDAELVRARLEVAGFHPVITHGLAALSIDGYALAAGGILVQVPDPESAEVIAFLKPDATSPAP